jgi:2-oxoglutarate dehydrogenase E2 component (dihydrolipoamide succinyltransferase)
MSALIAARQRHNPRLLAEHGVKIGITTFFVKAAVAALKAFPELNAEIDGEDVILKYHYDIGVAIGQPEGLVVPVIRDADALSYVEVERAIVDFAARAEGGTLTLDDLRGGTFSVTNGGVFGSLLSTPILNTPQVGILGLHRIEDRPIAVDGQVVVRPMMYVALTYDHRLVDGRDAVLFLTAVKRFVEDPSALLLAG